MTFQYLQLEDFITVACTVTGTNVETLIFTTKLNLADSALHAPQASFAGEDFYPEFVDKAAILLARLAKNHPLIDGNKRTAWVCFRLFIEMNNWEWTDYPSVDEAERVVLAVAASELSESMLATWLTNRISAK